MDGRGVILIGSLWEKLVGKRHDQNAVPFAAFDLLWAIGKVKKESGILIYDLYGAWTIYRCGNYNCRAYCFKSCTIEEYFMDFIAFDFPLSLFLPEKIQDRCSFSFIIVITWEASNIGKEIESLPSQLKFSIPEVYKIRINVDSIDCAVGG